MLNVNAPRFFDIFARLVLLVDIERDHVFGTYPAPCHIHDVRFAVFTISGDHENGHRECVRFDSEIFQHRKFLLNFSLFYTRPEKGKVMPEKLGAFVFDQFRGGYYAVGEKVGQAWQTGAELMKK